MRLRILILLATLSVALALSCDQRPADPALPTENIEWTRVQRLGFALTTASIWAANDHDIYVGQPTSERFGDVGLIDQSRLFHFDGVNWTELNISDPKEFGDTRVWGVDENNVYVAIKKLRHFNGITWSEEPIDAGIVTGTAANNVFAAAGNAVFHFTGVEWDTLLTLNQGYIRGLSAADDGSLWATTYDSVIVWNNATWSSVQWPADVYYGLQGLVAFSATSALAVRPYDRYYDPDSKIYRWDGNQWTVDAVFSQSLETLRANGPNDVYGVGANGAVVHYDGSSWTKLPRASSFALRAVFKVPGGNVLATGGTGKVVSFDGTRWKTLREGKLSSSELIWAESSSRFMVRGDYTVVFKHDGGAWTEEVLPGSGDPVTAFGGTSLDDLHASLANGAMLHYDGMSWTVEADSLALLGGMWTSPTGVILAAGRNVIYRFDGTWDPVLQGDFELSRITSDESGRILACGRGQHGIQVKFFDNTAWRDLPFGQDDPSTVCIGPDGELLIAGYRGMYRWDGKKFGSLTPPRSEGFHDMFNIGERVLAFGFETDGVYKNGLLNILPSNGTWALTRARSGEFLADTRGGISAWKP
jgi:hypothetical protein